MFSGSGIIMICQSKEEGQDQDSIQSSTTPDQGYHMDNDKTQETHIQESLEAMPFPAGDHKKSVTPKLAKSQAQHQALTLSLVHL